MRGLSQLKNIQPKLMMFRVRTSLSYLGIKKLFKSPKVNNINFGLSFNLSANCSSKGGYFPKPVIFQRNMSTSPNVGSVEAAIIRKLYEELNPTHVVVKNESYKHNVPKGSETHFHVLIVSNRFLECKGLIHRHRLVNKLLDFELKNGVHALSITAKTVDEYSKMLQDGNVTGTGTPNCMGGGINK